MEDFRSKSCKMDSFYGGKAEATATATATAAPASMQDLRCYSANYAANTTKPKDPELDIKMKKSKSTFGSSSKSWSFNDPELQRKTRVASYKVYTVEGKMKGSLRKSFRWIKNTCAHIVYGWH